VGTGKPYLAFLVICLVAASAFYLGSDESVKFLVHSTFSSVQTGKPEVREHSKNKFLPGGNSPQPVAKAPSCLQSLPDEHKELVSELSRLPLNVLRQAYQKKVDELEKDSIGKRFKSAESAADRKVRRETLFAFLQEPLQQSDFWLAKTVIPVADKQLSATLLLHFYDSAHITENSVASDNKEPKNLCWHLTTYFGDEPSEHWAGNSACLENIDRDGDTYYIVQMLVFEPFEAYYSHLAVPIPLRGSSDSLEMLETISRKWRKGLRLEWAPVARTVADQIQKDHRKLPE
jgi:hypothetical protein